MGPAPSSNSGSSSQSQDVAPVTTTTGGTGAVSIGFHTIPKGGNISVSVGKTTEKSGDTIITFPDGSISSTANPTPPSHPFSVNGYGGKGQGGYSVVTLFSIDFT